MRKNIHRLGLLSTVLAFTLVSGSTALALPSQATVHAQSIITMSTGQPDDSGNQVNPNKSAERGSHGATKLADAKLKSCENRQKSVTNIVARISDRGQKQLTLFGTIATRVETFYTDKGKTLSNYDALVADVNAKAVAAQAAVTTTSSDGSGFSCDGTDPKGFVSTFKDSLKTEISALQAYRTSVKNLIVGVKSVQGTTTSVDNKTTGGNQ